MNKLTKSMTRLMQPMAALIAYTCEDEYSHREYFLELRSIGKDGLMAAGKPASLKFIQNLTEGFSAEAPPVPYGQLPKGMLYADVRKGNERYVWHTTPCKRFLYFRDSLNIANGAYHLPGIVWVVEDHSLRLHAYKAKRLAPDTRLYAAPFFNVNTSDGKVCLGNAKLELPEKLSFLNLVKYWEDKFFLSEFSHILGSNPTKNNLVTVTKKSVDAFDHNELIPFKKLKLKDLLE